MKRQLFTMLSLMFLQTTVNAQISVQPALPASGMFIQPQLWNILVINSGNAAYSCSIKLVLTDRQTGQAVLTALTAPFTIAGGAKQLNIQTVGPVQYSYISGTFPDANRGLLPAGSYTACYTLTSQGKGNDLAEQCVDFDAEPLSPPLLIFPADSSRLLTAPGQFSWAPPSPAGMFGQLRYDILITEVQPGQGANEALENNIPFYTGGSLIHNLMSYTGAATAFEKNKWYAWQVVARDYTHYAGKSDIHVFKIEED